MGLADDLAASAPLNKGPACGLAAFVDGLEPDDRQAVLAALEQAGVTTPHVRRTLQSHGFDPPSVNTVNNHRRGDCKCRGREWENELTGVRA